MVYLLHFHTPFKHARHYLGYTDNLTSRIEAHSHGRGARLMEVVTEAGITWEVARTWSDGTRIKERQLKNRKNTWKLCPICRAERGMRPPIDWSGKKPAVQPNFSNP